MATLDDKLMGEKLHYYCSSSEDEGEEDDARGGGGGQQVQEPPAPTFYPSTEDGHNTGPKGVLSDWRRFKQLETEKREEQSQEKMALAKKLCLTARTNKEDEQARTREEDVDAELDALLDDDFLETYMARRMREMMAKTNQTKRFGRVLELPNADDFLNHIDEEDKSVTVIILIHEPGAEGCSKMSSCLSSLATDFTTTKFCSILSTTAGLSKHFKSSGVPALLVYKAGQLLGSFVRMTDQLGTDFYPSDVEGVLQEHGFLQERGEQESRGIRGQALVDSDDE